MSNFHRHMKRFADGKESPLDMHRRFAWGNKPCTTCGGAPVLRIKTFMKADDFTSTVEPGVMAMIAAACGGKLPTVPTKFGPIVRIGDAYACKACQKDAEVAAARLPEYVIVELDRGPKNIPIQVGATGLVLA
jgi:hypothetical protein